MATEEIVKDTNEKEKGKMIVFISGKGGVGKTVISINTAVALNEKGLETCIMDGNFQFGDVNLALDIQPTITIADIVKDSKPLDKIEIEDYLHVHDSGLKILAAPSKPEYADLITSSVVPAICGSIINNHDFLVVDLPSGLSDHNLSFLELADRIFLVTDLEMASLKNTKIMLRTLKMLDLEDKISILVNKSDSESLIKVNDVQDMLESSEIFCVSSNLKVVSRSVNIGIPFVISKPNEKITSEIITLTGGLHGSKSKNMRRKNRKQGVMDILKR